MRAPELPGAEVIEVDAGDARKGRLHRNNAGKAQRGQFARTEPCATGKVHRKQACIGKVRLIHRGAAKCFWMTPGWPPELDPYPFR